MRDTSGSAVRHQILLKAVMLKSALLEMRCSTVALPAAGTLLRSSRNLLCTQWQFRWVYRVWSLASCFNLDFRAVHVTAGLLSGSTRPLPGDLSCSGMTVPLSERLLPCTATASIVPLSGKPPLFLPPRLPSGFADQLDMAPGCLSPSRFPTTTRGSGAEPPCCRQGGMQGCPR